jgi:hypothetical protein
MTYTSAAAFRTALEQRLLTVAANGGVSIDRLRRRVMFERIVTRLDLATPGRWVLKGGMALEVQAPGRGPGHQRDRSRSAGRPRRTG